MAKQPKNNDLEDTRRAARDGSWGALGASAVGGGIVGGIGRDRILQKIDTETAPVLGLGTVRSAEYSPKGTAEIAGRVENARRAVYPNKTFNPIAIQRVALGDEFVSGGARAGDGTPYDLLRVGQFKTKSGFSPSILFHEAGHASQPRWLLREGSGHPKSWIGRMGFAGGSEFRAGAPVVAGMAAGAAVTSDNPYVATGAGLLAAYTAAPSLMQVGMEADAWVRGGRLHAADLQARGKTFSRARWLKNMAPGLSTYVGNSAIPTVAAGVGLGLYAKNTRDNPDQRNRVMATLGTGGVGAWAGSYLGQKLYEDAASSNMTGQGLGPLTRTWNRRRLLGTGAGLIGGGLLGYGIERARQNRRDAAKQ